MEKDIIERAITEKGRELLKEADGIIEYIYVKLELIRDDRRKNESYSLVATTSRGVVKAEYYATKEEVDDNYLSLVKKYNLNTFQE